MTASKYKVWAWGGSVGLGATGSVFVGMSAIAKKATPAEPYIVGNELVCNMIARALLLPCPPGALLQKNGDTYFCSLDFNTAGHALPPINPSTVVGTLPELSWGVVLFDVLVMNGDRHPQNISYNTTTSELTLFDHSHAFMTTSGDVDQRLANARGQLMIGGHCLAAELNTWNGFDPWVTRVKSLPDYYLEGATEEGCAVGIPHAKKATIYDFLRERRDDIDRIVTNNKVSWSRKSGQDDKWKICLRTAIVAANRRDHEKTATSEPLTGLQSEGGPGRHQGRSDDRPTCRAIRRPPQSDHGVEIAA